MHGLGILAQTSTDGIWQFRLEFLVPLMAVALQVIKSLWNAFGFRNRQGRASDRIRRYLRDPSRPGGLWKELRIVDCLRPVRVADPEEIRRLHRIPLEYNLGKSRLSDLWVHVRLFFLGPSYPKPAFAITHHEIVPESRVVRQQQDAHCQQSFTAGGYRLNILLDHGESRRHFMRSMVQGALTTGRTVVVCSPEELAHGWDPVRCFDVYAAPGQAMAQPFPGVTLFSRDPLFAGGRRGEYSSPASVPDGAIWLVDVGPRGTEEGARPGGVASRDPQGLPRQFPVPVWRRFVYLVTLAALACLVLRIVLLANFGIGSPNLPEWYDTLAVVTGVYLLVPATLWYFFKYSLREWSWARFGEVSWQRNGGEGGGAMRLCPRPQASVQWTATTTRCIADGFTVRNRDPRPGMDPARERSRSPAALESLPATESPPVGHPPGSSVDVI